MTVNLSWGESLSGQNHCDPGQQEPQKRPYLLDQSYLLLTLVSRSHMKTSGERLRSPQIADLCFPKCSMFFLILFWKRLKWLLSFRISSGPRLYLGLPGTDLWVHKSVLTVDILDPTRSPSFKSLAMVELPHRAPKAPPCPWERTLTSALLPVVIFLFVISNERLSVHFSLLQKPNTEGKNW